LDLDRKGSLKAAMEGFTAAVDFPVCLYYREMMELYPHAKILLTIRDSPEVWYASMVDTIASPMKTPASFAFDYKNYVHYGQKLLFYLPGLGYTFYRFLGPTLMDFFDHSFDDEERIKKIYTDWIEEVKRVVPPGQLLIFNVKQGWDPLVEFLGIEKPPKPFPRVADTEEMLKMLGALATLGYLQLFLYAFVAQKILTRATTTTSSNKNSKRKRRTKVL